MATASYILNIVLLMTCALLSLLLNQVWMNQQTSNTAADNYKGMKEDKDKIIRRRLGTNNASPMFHPLDALTKEELEGGIAITKSYFEQNTMLVTESIIIHLWSNKLPNKYDTIDYIYNSDTNIGTSNFSKVLQLDLSIMDRANKTYFYNLLVNIDNGQILIKALQSSTGYPITVGNDFDIITETLLSDSDVVNYFINKLGMDPAQFSNITCVPSSPLRDYLTLLLSDEIANIEYLFDNYRLATSWCFDLSYTVVNPHLNQIPFFALINLDLRSIIKTWECDDPQMNVDCTHFKQYNPEWIWGNSVSEQDLTSPPYNIDLDSLNKCKKEQFDDVAIRRPKGYMSSIDGKGLFEIENNVITWQEWKFHEQLNIRFGPILSDIRFDNRSVVYSLLLSDMYVPYHDLDNIQWYSKAFMDGSHYGAAAFVTVNLTENMQECPGEAIFLQQYVVTSTGEVIESGPYACVFERFSDEIRVRHVDGINGFSATVPTVELVYRSVLTIGNYDYVLDYAFQLDGTIRVNMAATGFNQVSQNTGLNQNKYCNLLSKNYCSQLHDHYFSFRVDVDVDEIENNFHKGKLQLEKRKLNSNYGKRKPNKMGDKYQNSYYYIEDKIRNEKRSISTKTPHAPGSWVFRSVSDAYYNENSQTQSGYEIIPTKQVIAFWDTETDIRDSLAMWIGNGLYVTKYEQDELYASGKYTWQQNTANGADGLAQYIDDNECIRDSDLVAWVTLGFHHLPRTEDLPVLPKHSNSFVITPFNYFQYTPAVCGDDIY